MNSDQSAEGGSGGGKTMNPARVQFPRASFREFSRRIDEQLAQLIAQWVHLAAPASLRSDVTKNRRPR
jgi:hypothetical protein